MNEQILTAVTACEARIENGADIAQAFQWLRDEIARINAGEVIYD